MAISVHFNYESKHRITKSGGLISTYPSLPHSSRLYVIRHIDAVRYPYYIGTASNVKDRFDERLRSIRELGFRNTEIGNIRIAVVQIFINGRPRTPQDYGIADGIDVEHLLIRFYVALGRNVRNMVKTNQFQNTYGTPLDCTFANTINWGHFVPGNERIPTNYYV